MKIFRILTIALISLFVLLYRYSEALVNFGFDFETSEAISSFGDINEISSGINWPLIPDSQLPASSDLYNPEAKTKLDVPKVEVSIEDQTRFIETIRPEIMEQLSINETIATQTIDQLVKASNILSINDETGSWEIVKGKTIDDAINEAREIISEVKEIKDALEIEEIDNIQMVEGLFNIRELIKEGKLDIEDLSGEFSVEVVEAMVILNEDDITEAKIEEILNSLSSEEILKIVESGMVNKNVELSIVDILIDELVTLSVEGSFQTKRIDLTLQTLGVLTNRYNEELGNETLNKEIGLVLNLLKNPNAEDFASSAFFLLWDIWAWSLEKETIELSQSTKDEIIKTGLEFVEKTSGSALETGADYLEKAFDLLQLSIGDETFENDDLCQKVIDTTVDFLQEVTASDKQITDGTIANAFKLLAYAGGDERFKGYREKEIIKLGLSFLDSSLEKETLRWVCNTIGNFPKESYLNAFLNEFLSLDKQTKMDKISSLIDLLGDEKGKIDSVVLPKLETVFEDTTIDIDREVILNNLIGEYKERLGSDEVEDAVRRRSLAACFVSIARLNEEWKGKVSDELNLSGTAKEVWDEYGILIINTTREFDEENEAELSILQSVLSFVPKELLKGLKVIAASDGSEDPGWLYDAFASTLRGGIISIIKNPSTVGTSLYMRYFLHEVGHMIDFEILTKEQREKFDGLHENSGKGDNIQDIMDYARPYGMYNRYEDFATCFEAFITAPIANLARAKFEAEKGNEDYLNKMLFMKELLTDENGKTHFVNLPIFGDGEAEAVSATIDIDSLTDNFTQETYLRLGLAYEEITKELTSATFLNELSNAGLDIEVSKEDINDYYAFAIKYYQKVKFDKQNPEAYYFAQFHTGECYRKKGSYNHALDYYKMVPEDSKIFEEAEQGIDKIQRLLTGSDPLMPELEVYEKLGWEELEQGIYYLKGNNVVNIHVRNDAKLTTIDLNNLLENNTEGNVTIEIALHPDIPFDSITLKIGDQEISYDPQDGKTCFTVTIDGKEIYIFLLHGRTS